MEIEFDLEKDAANISKHGISLGRARDMIILAYRPDARFEEPRYRLFGLIDEMPYCLAAVNRDGRVRAISLRRAHEKEMRRYVTRPSV